MGTRAGAAFFWCFLAANAVAAAGLAHLVPDNWALPSSHYGDIPLPGVPLQPIIGFLLCLPTARAGVRRLHDIGRSGGAVLPPFIVLACFTAGPVLLPPVALTLIGLGRDQAIAIDPRLAGKIYVGAMLLGALFIAAGTLRTLFLWLQPGDPDRNRYGPAPPKRSPAPENPVARHGGLLSGRMQRLTFWTLLAVNAALARGGDYLVAHWPQLYPQLPQWLTHNGATAFAELSWLVIAGTLGGPLGPAHLKLLLAVARPLLYLPAFAASVPRLHDQNRSAALALSVLVASMAAPFAEPLLGAARISMLNLAIDFVTFYLLFLCLQPGSMGANRYGPPPGQTAPLAKPVAPPPCPEPSVQAAPRAAVRPPLRARGKPSFGRRGA